VGARAPFDRGRLVAVEVLSKSAKELSYGSRFHSIGSEGSMPPSEGIPPPTSSLASNMSEGVSRKRLKPWPYTGPLSVIPNSVYSRAPIEPWRGPTFEPSRFVVGKEPVVPLPRSVHL
jgi:hypothetical protein